MAILQIKNLTVRSGQKTILDNLSIDFEKGGVYAIVGPNGAGKSTLASCIMGLEDYKDIEGEIIFEGRSLNAETIDERARRGITLGWQEPARYEGLSVKRFISAGAKDKSQANLENAMKSVGLNPDEYLQRAVDKTLSGGERKKVELASILLLEPKLVIFDEPDSGIDVGSLENIFDAIDFLRSRGSTLLLITHNTQVLEQAEFAYLLCCGRIVEKGPITEINQYFKDICVPCTHKNIPEEDNG